MQFEKWYDIDLKKPRQFMPDLGFPVFKGDKNSVRVGVHVFSDKEETNVAGSVEGYVLLPNGAMAPVIEGEKDGNAAWVDLSELSLALVGRIQVAIRLVDGDEETVIFAACATVRRVGSETIIDPDDVIPTWDDILDKIAQMDTATQAANTAAGRAETAALTAVTYAEQTGKTDAEKAQARENVSAASETVLTAMASLTEYGAILEQQNYSRSGVTVVRTGTCSTINGTRDSSEIVRFRMYQAGTTRAGSVPTASQNISGGAQIKAGRTYRLCGRLISGTYTPPETPIYYNDNWRLNAYYTGTTSAWNSRTLIRDGVNYVEECTPEADGEICVWLATIPNSTFTDAVLEIWLEDVTDVLRPGTIATQEEPSSSSATYHAGDLLTVGGTLYKATQAIAAGEVITPGTNVTETTVAAQLAALEARIAALEG